MTTEMRPDLLLRIKFSKCLVCIIYVTNFVVRSIFDLAYQKVCIEVCSWPVEEQILHENLITDDDSYGGHKPPCLKFFSKSKLRFSKATTQPDGALTQHVSLFQQYQNKCYQLLAKSQSIPIYLQQTSIMKGTVCNFGTKRSIHSSTKLFHMQFLTYA